MEFSDEGYLTKAANGKTEVQGQPDVLAIISHFHPSLLFEGKLRSQD